MSAPLTRQCRFTIFVLEQARECDAPVPPPQLVAVVHFDKELKRLVPAK